MGAKGFARLSHLKELALIGGDKAAQEPWRMGAALLATVGKENAIAERYREHPGAAWFKEALGNRKLTKKTTALGRYFDGISSLLGLCDIQHDEATAAMRLEALASKRVGRVLLGWSVTDHTIDFTGIIDELLANGDKAQAAADFHRTLARALAQSVFEAAKELSYQDSVAITGGCAANKLLFRALKDDLESLGLSIAIPREVPAGDGGLSLGELWLAALNYEAKETEHKFFKNPSEVN